MNFRSYHLILFQGFFSKKYVLADTQEVCIYIKCIIHTQDYTLLYIFFYIDLSRFGLSPYAILLLLCIKFKLQIIWFHISGTFKIVNYDICTILNFITSLDDSWHVSHFVINFLWTQINSYKATLTRGQWLQNIKVLYYSLSQCDIFNYDGIS